jgi:hypothetical protein
MLWSKPQCLLDAKDISKAKWTPYQKKQNTGNGVPRAIEDNFSIRPTSRSAGPALSAELKLAPVKDRTRTGIDKSWQAFFSFSKSSKRWLRLSLPVDLEYRH